LALAGSIMPFPESRKILLVDDDRDLLELLAGLLAMRGFTPLVARNGLEALELLENSSPHSVILLDLNMPVMDGVEFLARRAAKPGDRGDSGHNHQRQPRATIDESTHPSKTLSASGRTASSRSLLHNVNSAL
jgi:CheY-like chemotaxis protein